MNVHRGALAVGHPLGASGARILVELLNVLKKSKAWSSFLCIGGGEAVAVELVNNN